jgi:hypothetical protein
MSITIHNLIRAKTEEKKWQQNLVRKGIPLRLLDGQQETTPGSSLLSNSLGGSISYL